MESTHSQPLLQENSESEAEQFEDSENQGSRDNSPTENPEKELIRNGPSVPHDKYSFNYIIFYLMGMTTLLPWNFFITAEGYWLYKFRNVTANATDDLTPIQAGFTSDLSVSAAVPNTMFLVLNAFIGHKIPLKIRMVGSLTFVFIFFIATTALVEVNTDTWQNEFFIFTLTSVVLMNIATAILSGGLFGISGLFPSEYITAVVSGQALGGIFAALAEILSLTFGASAKTTAFVYFMIGNVVLLVSIVTYIIMSKTVFFKYYTVDKLAMSKSQTSISDTSSSTVRSNGPDFQVVLRKIWMYGLSEWLVFVVTLSIYPSVTVLVTSQGHGNGHPWNDIYFVPVVNYLIFNSGDYLGRILAGMIEWPHNKPVLVAILSLLRVFFIPALLLCNARPRRLFPVMIHADYIFIILMGLFSFSNGYLANISLIWAPKSVHNREKEMASSMMAAFLGIGLAFGSSISLILVQLI
ncbi:Equilibrative nucleoside transporter 1 [Pseudolycoriella hygida]|uniref:Equilibrative nucleoside transporter 1 n=1 Tax=Pseudolycoriella hygida TaxID=35572 RepID=A0A9Q0N8R4_9DIPT|nr:Equilibrative nucleoside transporter 1 [Pseudolycoriella hygida]